MDELLQLLRKNALESPANLAAMLNTDGCTIDIQVS